MTLQIRRVGQHAVLFATIRQELLGEHLQERLGPSNSFEVDLRTGGFAFSSDRGRITARAALIASIAVEPATLVWGWGPMFADRVAPDSEPHRLRAFGEQHGLPEFVEAEVPYDVGDVEPRDRITELSHDLGHVAVEVLGPQWHYYSMPTGSAGSRFVLAVADWSDAPPQPTMVDVFTKLPRLLQDVDDVGWALDGLARLMPGWRCERRPDAGPGKPAWRLADAAGDWFEVACEFDASNRLVSTRCDGVHRAKAPAA